MLESKPTHGGGAPFGIDLDGGTAKITIPMSADETAAETADLDGASDSLSDGMGDQESAITEAVNETDESLDDD